MGAFLDTALRCINATGKRKYLDDTIPTFTGVAYVYDKENWNATFYSQTVDFEKAAHIYSSLVSSLLHLPLKSSLSQTLVDYVEGFEDFLAQTWDKHEELVSLEMMRAVTFRLRAKGRPLKKKRRSVLKRWAKLQIERFAGVKQVASDVKGHLQTSLDMMKDLDPSMRNRMLKGVDHYVADMHGGLESQIMQQVSNRIGMGGYPCKLQRGLLPAVSLL